MLYRSGNQISGGAGEPITLEFRHSAADIVGEGEMSAADELKRCVRTLGHEGDLQRLNDLAQCRLTEGMRDLVEGNAAAGGDNKELLDWVMHHSRLFRSAIKARQPVPPPGVAEHLVLDGVTRFMRQE